MLGYILVRDKDKIKKIRDIPDQIKIVALTPIVYPNKETVRNKLFTKLIGSNNRKSIEKMFHYETW